MSCVLFALALVFLMAPDARGGQASYPFPDPDACLLPPLITLVGLGPAGPDSACGHFEVVLRDRWGGAYEGVLVIVDFGANGPIRPAADQHDPRLTVDCTRHTVRTYSGDGGVASFTIVGGGRAGAQPPHDDHAAIMTEYGGIGTVRVAVLDLNGDGRVTLADLNVWSADFFSGQYRSRSDYDGSSDLALLDLSLWADAYFRGGSLIPTELCP